MNAEELAGRIFVRHREPGHLRFDIPAELCGPGAAQALDQGLRALPGVYRVSLDAGAKKLSIRYEEHTCSQGQVARRLKSLLAELPTEAPASENTTLTSSTPQTETANPADPAALLRDAARGLAGRFQAFTESLRHPPAGDGSVEAKLQPVLASAFTERAVTNFLNDVVAFYLIKVHWEMISQRWLKEPLKYGNAWLTVFYMVLLLVRYRKQASKADASAATVGQVSTET